MKNKKIFGIDWCFAGDCGSCVWGDAVEVE